ncbi:hypothetical protein GF378_01640, partial [Candidatus Pacearchaeota archaeon]|nr:hypothetical protein [Candidatus Pacearchaeota archaeon]
MMKNKTKLKIALISLIVFISINLAIALQVPNFGDYDQDGDVDFVMQEIVQNQNDTLFYEMNTYYNILPAQAEYGFFIKANEDAYLDVYLVYHNTTNKMLLYNATNANFTDITEDSNSAGSADSPIGATTADFNGDGHADLFANNSLYMGYSNTSFEDITNLSNLAELPSLTRVIAWDFNEDNRTDILGLNESGEELILLLNLGDANGDNAPEFWDASFLSQLTDLTKADLAEAGANSITAGAMHNHSHNVTGVDYFVNGIYIPRNGTDLLLDTFLSSVFFEDTYTDIPEFRWLNVSSRFTGNTSKIEENSTDAVFTDMDNN